MYKYSEEDLQKLRQVQLDILAEVIRICDKHSIRWFTDGGTTIGAVRHQGFIPWDDDVDIAMLREDYDKFLRVAPKEINSGYVVAHYEFDKNTPFYFAKVRRENTLFVEEAVKDLNIHHGIYIDIFPYDVVPINKGVRSRHKKKIQLYSRQLSYRTTSTGDKNETNKLKYFLKTLYKKITRYFLMPFKKSYFYEKLDRQYRKYVASDSQLISPCIGGDFVVNKNEIFPTIKMPFESIFVEVPKNYDDILRQSFGDYMQLPPENKRFNHAPAVLKFEEDSLDNN